MTLLGRPVTNAPLVLSPTVSEAVVLLMMVKLVPTAQPFGRFTPEFA